MMGGVKGVGWVGEGETDRQRVMVCLRGVKVDKIRRNQCDRNERDERDEHAGSQMHTDAIIKKQKLYKARILWVCA